MREATVEAEIEGQNILVLLVVCITRYPFYLKWIRAVARFYQ